MDTSFTWAQVCARRLARHGLMEPTTGSPADVVAALAGLHAQVPSAAELTVEPFGRVRRAHLDEQADRVAAVLGATPELTVGEVTVGGHA